MKPGTRDEVEGKFYIVNREVKEKAGRLTNDPNVEAGGHAENAAVKVQKGIDKTAEMHEKFPDLGKE